MCRAIHGFHTVDFLLTLEPEHVVSIVGIVARDFPKISVENVWSNNFFESSDTVLVPDEVHELVVKSRSVWIEEGTAR